MLSYSAFRSRTGVIHLTVGGYRANCSQRIRFVGPTILNYFEMVNETESECKRCFKGVRADG